MADQEHINLKPEIPDDCHSEIKRSDPMHFLKTVDTSDGFSFD